jgi:hypothetical protein
MRSGILCLAVATLGLLSSCKKDSVVTPVTPQQKGTVAVAFENYAGTQALELTGSIGFPYSNANGDVFKVTMYKYYVSNVRFVRADGTEYAEPESYHLIDANDKSTLSFNLGNVPGGTYTSVKVLLGVDSAHNVSGAQTGALDPIHGMFWTWSSGYIMAKIEGNSPQSSVPDGKLSFHLGGFSGTYSVLNEVVIPLPQSLVVGNNTTSTVTFRSDILKWFAAPNMIKFAELNAIGSAGNDAFKVAKNYSNSLSVSKVQN